MKKHYFFIAIWLLATLGMTGNLLHAQSGYDFIARYAEMKYNDKVVTPTTNPVGLGQYIYMGGYNSYGNNLFRFDTENPDFSALTINNTDLIGQYIIDVDSLDADHLWLLTNSTYDLYKLNINTFDAQLICDSIPNSSVIQFNGKLFFSKSTETNGDELWSSDGSASGTGMFADLWQGFSSSSERPFSSEPERFFIFKGRLWFTAVSGGTEPRKYFSTDGQSAPVPHFSLDSVSGIAARGSEYKRTREIVWGDRFYFASLIRVERDGRTELSEKMYLFASDGTLEGTVSITELPLTNISEMIVIDNKLWMIGSLADVTGDHEIVVFDGENTSLVQITENKNSFFNNLLHVDGKTLVFGRDPRFNNLSGGYVLYEIDSTFNAVKQNIYNVHTTALAWPSDKKPFIAHQNKAYMTGWNRFIALDNFVNVEGLNLSDTILNINVGQQAKLKASVYPINATFQDVYFQSSNTYSATVDETGWVTGIAKGYAEIEIRDAMYSKSRICRVNVSDEPTSLEQNNSDIPSMTYSAIERTVAINSSEIPVLTVFGMTGKIVYQTNGLKADLKYLPKGLYVVQAAFEHYPYRQMKIVVQ